MPLISFAPFLLYFLGIFYMPLLYGGFAFQTAYLILRGIELGRIPLVGIHDTLNFLSASMVAFSIPFYKSMKGKKAFYLMLSAMAGVFSIFALSSKPYAQALPPVLRTYWFELHVILSFFSYALFAIAAIIGVVYLRLGHSGGARDPQYKAVLIGYSFFSLSMIFGGIWAYLAWGTYWLWTPKELWTTILWIFYSLYLHARLMKWWSGKPSTILAIAGFVIVLFTYLGVGLFMKSSHAF